MKLPNILNRWRGNVKVIGQQQKKINFLTEQLSAGGQLWLSNAMRGKGGYGSNLIEDIYDDRLLTPHEEMRECRRMYLTNALAVTSVETATRVILGDQLSVDANKATTNFFEEIFEETDFMVALREGIENYIQIGNGYMEKLRNIKYGTIGEFAPVPRPECMYHDVVKGVLQRYILEYPTSIRQKGAQYFNIKYLGHQKRIYGIEIPKDRLIYFKYGVGAYSEYGRSPLASSVNDNKILREIERSFAIMARHKAVPKKFIRFIDQEGNDISDIERDKQINFMAETEDFENIVINRKPEIQDMGYGGREINLEPAINHLKSKATSAIAPSFYIFGNETNYAVANKQMDIFLLKINDSRFVDIGKPINRMLRAMAIENNLDRKVRIKFGRFSFMDEKDTFSEWMNRYNIGACTLDEYRLAVGMKKFKGEGGDELKPKSAPPMEMPPEEDE